MENSDAFPLCQHLLLGLDLLLLLAEDPPTHLQDGFEALFALAGVLREPSHGGLLDGVLHLLPATAQGRDLRVLYKFRLRGGEGLVDDGLLHTEDVRPGHVRRGHSDLLRYRIDIGGLEDVRGLSASHERTQPFRRALLAGDEAFSA